jgi:iron(III) transport system permease protein
MESGLTVANQVATGRKRRMTGVRAPRALAAAAIIVAALMLLPLAYLLLRAAGLGITQAFDLLTQARTLEVTVNSLVLALLVTAISLLIALPLAWLTARTDLPGARAWTVIATLPLVFPSYVGAFALVAMLGPRGMLQGWLEPLGVERLPSIYGLPGATWALTLFSYPYLFLSIRAGLQMLDPALDEAARSLGRSAWQSFWRITLPALRPAIASGALLVALYTLSDFGAVSLLRYPSFTRIIYIQYQSSFDRSQAAVLGLVLVALTLALLVAAQRIQGKRRFHRAGVGATRRARLVYLGRWRAPALLFCTTVAVAAVVLPVSVIVYWLVRGLLVGESLLPMWLATWNSLRAALLAAVTTVLLALPVAYFAVRYPSRLSMITSRAAYIGYGLPGIIVALSLVYFGANYAPILYQTMAMLVFAYTVRFLPEALGTLRTNLFQISVRLEEAARSLGLSQGQAVRRVTLPLLRSGMWAGAALVFLSVIKELPATLLLAPTGFTTLSTQIWAATAEVSFTRAAAPSLLLLVVSALSLILTLPREGSRE